MEKTTECLPYLSYIPIPEEHNLQLYTFIRGNIHKYPALQVLGLGVEERGGLGSVLNSSAPKQYICLLLSMFSESPLFTSNMTLIMPFCLITVRILYKVEAYRLFSSYKLVLISSHDACTRCWNVSIPSALLRHYCPPDGSLGNL